MSNTCFICDKPVPQFNWSIGYIVTCPRCGEYKPSERLLQKLYENPFSNRYLYSAAIRELYERNGRDVWVEDLESLLDSVAVPTSPIQKIDKLLMYLAAKTSAANLGIAYETSLFPVAYAKDENELHWFIRSAKDEAHYLVTGSVGDQIVLTMEGWRRVEEISKLQPDSTQAFVAMSFEDDLLEVWKEGFKPALIELGYEPIRVDTKQTNDKIDDKIIADIRKSGLVVTDFTSQRNGVYFEAGFSMGLGIPVIWTCRDTDIKNLHFDTRQYSHIKWANINDLKRQLVDRIEATLPNRPRLSTF